MGRPRKPLAEVYSQERPVARHFVYDFYSTRGANLKFPKFPENEQAVQFKASTNCPLGGNFYGVYGRGNSPAEASC